MGKSREITDISSLHIWEIFNPSLEVETGQSAVAGMSRKCGEAQLSLFRCAGPQPAGNLQKKEATYVEFSEGHQNIFLHLTFPLESSRIDMI